MSAGSLQRTLEAWRIDPKDNVFYVRMPRVPPKFTGNNESSLAGPVGRVLFIAQLAELAHDRATARRERGIEQMLLDIRRVDSPERIRSRYARSRICGKASRLRRLHTRYDPPSADSGPVPGRRAGC